MYLKWPVPEELTLIQVFTLRINLMQWGHEPTILTMTGSPTKQWNHEPMISGIVGPRVIVVQSQWDHESRPRSTNVNQTRQRKSRQHFHLKN